MGLEPTTISLATRCSTTELRPLGCMRLIYTISRISQAGIEKKYQKNKWFSMILYEYQGNKEVFFLGDRCEKT